MKRKTVRSNLCRSLGLLMTILGILIFLASLLLVLLVTNNISSYSEEYISDQIQRHSTILLKDNSNLLTNYLRSQANGLIRPVVYSAENLYLSNFIPINSKISNFFDWDISSLSQPTTFSSRQQRVVSLENSAYYLPNTFLSDLPNIPLSTQQLINSSNYLDLVWTTLYDRYPDFVNVFVGFSNGGLFRKFPGVNSSQTDRSYDPRNRSWYSMAMGFPNQITITPPYIDAHGLGTMITFAQTFSDPSGNFQGVVGGDLLINTLVSSVQNISLYTTGHLILMLTDGTIIVNKDNDTSFVSLINTNINVGETGTVTQGDYIYEFLRIADFGGKYILIAKILSSEITKPVDEVRNVYQLKKLG